MKSLMEKEAYGLATAHFACFNEEIEAEHYYDAYLKLVDDVEQDREPQHLTTWLPFENYSNSDLLDSIDLLAEEILDLMKKHLPTGNVNSTVNSIREKLLFDNLAILNNENVSEAELSLIKTWIQSNSVGHYCFITCCFAMNYNPFRLREHLMSQFFSKKNK